MYMRADGRTCTLLLSFTFLIGACATIKTEKRTDETILSTREDVAPPSGRVPRATLTMVDSTLVADLQMERRCEYKKFQRVRSTEKITRTAQGDIRTWEYVLGALATAGGAIALGVSPGLSDDPGVDSNGEEVWSTRKKTMVGGGAALGVGVSALIAGLIDSYKSRDSIGRVSEDERVVERREQSCGSEAGAGVPVDLLVRVHSGGQSKQERYSLGSTDGSGRLSADLATVIPKSVFATAEPPKSGTVATAAGDLGSIELGAIALLVEKAAWEELESDASVEALSAFQRSYPWSQHASEVRQRISTIQQKEIEGAWAALGARAKVPDLEAFVERYRESTYASEAAVRIVDLHTKARAFDEARASVDRLAAGGVLSGELATAQRTKIDEAAEAETKRLRGVASAAAKLSDQCAGQSPEKQKETARKAHRSLRSVKSGLSSGEYHDAESRITGNCRCSPNCAGVSK